MGHIPQILVCMDPGLGADSFRFELPNNLYSITKSPVSEEVTLLTILSLAFSI